MEQEQLFPLVRKGVQYILGNYIAANEILEKIEQYIVPARLGPQAGVLGAIALAQRAAERN
jgi:fructokinase